MGLIYQIASQGERPGDPPPRGVSACGGQAGNRTGVRLVEKVLDTCPRVRLNQHMETNTNHATTTTTDVRRVWVILSDLHDNAMTHVLTGGAFATEAAAERAMHGYDEDLNPRIVPVSVAATHTEWTL